ncbi:MAG: hypothetical protein JSV62_10055 [Promethearchaeota archaeon]|nr:MAG: hypothetical protein JSV62_10055 [Candidatus Lokiarchaeota archaeon]
MIEFIILILIIFLSINFIVSTIISIWVYRDAKKKELNVFLWFLIVWLIPFLFGVLIYLKQRD